MAKYIKYFLYLIGILLIGVFFILFIWPLAPDVLLWRFSDSILANSDDALTKKGQFGDSFGGINALLSGVVFIGVIIAIILQWLALKNQQQEMKEQKLAMQQETFERTFFHLLEAIKECYHSTEHTKFVEVPLGADVAQHQEDILQSYRKINSPNPIIVSEPFTDLDGVRGVNVTTVGDTAFVSVIKNNRVCIKSKAYEGYKK